MARSIVVLLLAAGAAVCDTDSSEHSILIGYDHGLSFRYYPRPALGFGLLVQPAAFASLYASLDADYTDSYDERHSVSSGYNARKGGSALLEVLYRRRIGSRFYLTPFLSLGARYTTQTDSYSYEHFEGDSSVYSNSTEAETRTWGFVGQLGVMPGVRFGPVTIEFRLGLGGEIASTDSPDSPGEATRTSTTESTEKDLYVVYPADLIGSLVIHIGFR